MAWEEKGEGKGNAKLKGRAIAADSGARRVVMDVVAAAIARLLAWVVMESSLLRGAGLFVPVVAQLLHMVARARAGSWVGGGAHMCCMRVCVAAVANIRMRVCAAAVANICACGFTLRCVGGAWAEQALCVHTLRVRISAHTLLSDAARGRLCALQAQGTVNSQ